MDAACAVFPLLAVVGDQVWIALIGLGTVGLSVFGAAFGGWMAYRQKQLDANQQKLLILAKATYTFQNHQMGVALKGVAIACRSKAEITKTPEDIKEAEQAEQAYLEHQRGQAKVDAQALISKAEQEARTILEDALTSTKKMPAVDKVNEHLQIKPHEDSSVATGLQAIKEISKTHDIKGTVELTPKETEKGGV